MSNTQRKNVGSKMNSTDITKAVEYLEESEEPMQSRIGTIVSHMQPSQDDVEIIFKKFTDRITEGEYIYPKNAHKLGVVLDSFEDKGYEFSDISHLLGDTTPLVTKDSIITACISIYLANNKTTEEKKNLIKRILTEANESGIEVSEDEVKGHLAVVTKSVQGDTNGFSGVAEMADLTITIDGPNSVVVGDMASFTLESESEDAISSVTWYVDNAEVGEGLDLTQTFGEAGEFTLMCEAIDSDDRSVHATKRVVSLDPGAHSITFEGDDRVPIGQPSTFKANVADGLEIVSCEWISDGEVLSETPSVTTTFDDSGVHDLEFTAELRSGGVVTDTLNVEGYETAIDVSLQPPGGVIHINELVSFGLDVTPLNSDVASISYTVNGGTPQTVDSESKFAHSFSEVGEHQIEVTVENEFGDSSKDSCTVDVHVPADVCIAEKPTDITYGEPIQIPIDYDPQLDLEANLEGGKVTSITEAGVIADFTNVDSQLAILETTVTNSAGETGTDRATIKLPDVPSDITIDAPDFAHVGDPISITVDTTELAGVGVEDVQWFDGSDDDVGTGKSVEMEFSSVGTKEIECQVELSHGDTVIRSASIEVVVDPVVEITSAPDKCVVGEEYHVSIEVPESLDVQWDVPDHVTIVDKRSNGVVIRPVKKANGRATVSGAVENSIGEEATDSVSLAVLNKAVNAWIAAPSAGTVDEEIELKLEVNNGTEICDVTWVTTEGGVLGHDQDISTTFEASGEREIIAQFRTESGVEHEISHTINIHPNADVDISTPIERVIPGNSYSVDVNADPRLGVEWDVVGGEIVAEYGDIIEFNVPENTARDAIAVHATVNPQVGESNTTTAELDVTQPSDILSFDIPEEVYVGDRCNLELWKDETISVDSITWKLDDNPIGGGETLTQTFTNKGKQTIACKMITDVGESVELCEDIRAVQNPDVEISVAPDTIAVGEEFTIRTSTPSQELDIDWEVEQGSLKAVNGDSCEIVCDQHVDSIDVEVTVSNSVGEQDTDSISVTVLDPVVSVSVGAPDRVEPEVEFEAVADCEIENTRFDSIEWFHNEQPIGEGETLEYTIKESGDHTLRAEVDTAAGTYSDETIVECYAEPEISINASEDQIEIDEPIEFTAECDNRLSVDWDCESWEIDSQSKGCITARFHEPGEQTVKVRVENQNDESGDDSITIETIDPSLAVSLTKSHQPCVGEEVQFFATANHEFEERVREAKWEINNTMIGRGDETAYEFGYPGEYKVELHITTNDGDTQTESLVLEVDPEPDHSGQSQEVDGQQKSVADNSVQGVFAREDVEQTKLDELDSSGGADSDEKAEKESESDTQAEKEGEEEVEPVADINDGVGESELAEKRDFVEEKGESHSKNEIGDEHVVERKTPETYDLGDSVFSMPNYVQDIIDFEFILEKDDGLLPDDVDGAGIVVVDDDRYVGIAKVTGRSWAIHTMDKKKSICKGYGQNVLAGLSNHIEIINVPTRIDLQAHTQVVEDVLKQKEDDPEESLLNVGRAHYPNWVEEFADQNETMEQEYYVIIDVSDDQLQRFKSQGESLMEKLGELPVIGDRFGDDEVDEYVTRYQCLREMNSRFDRLIANLNKIDVKVERVADKDRATEVLYKYFNDKSPRREVFPTSPFTSREDIVGDAMVGGVDVSDQLQAFQSGGSGTQNVEVSDK